MTLLRLSAALPAPSVGRSVLAPTAAATALLLCNRAAAQHAQELRLDALMDCGRALVLCPSHAKSLSRRAALFVELRLPGDAVADLDKLIGLPGVAQTEIGQARAPSPHSLELATALSELQRNHV